MKTEKDIVIDIITEAFNENKSFNYVVKQDKSRAKRMKSLVEYCYNICKKYGEIHVSEDQTAVALINLPHKAKKNSLFSIGQDIRLIFKTIGIERLPLVLKRESVLKANHPNSPFCHLWYIGVKNDSQGKGAGSSLLLKIINKYKDEGLPIYLETSMDQNVPWYEKHGFDVYNTNTDFGFTTYMIHKLA